MTERPVAFRVRNPEGGYWLTEFEYVAAQWSDEYKTTYDGLYPVGDRPNPQRPILHQATPTAMAYEGWQLACTFNIRPGQGVMPIVRFVQSNVIPWRVDSYTRG